MAADSLAAKLLALAASAEDDTVRAAALGRLRALAAEERREMLARTDPERRAARVDAAPPSVASAAALALRRAGLEPATGARTRRPDTPGRATPPAEGRGERTPRLAAQTSAALGRLAALGDPAAGRRASRSAGADRLAPGV